VVVVSGDILKTLPDPIDKHVLLLFYDLSCKIAATAGKKATTDKEHVAGVPYKELLNPFIKVIYNSQPTKSGSRSQIS
jgi:hypothetical protein